MPSDSFFIDLSSAPPPIYDSVITLMFPIARLPPPSMPHPQVVHRIHDIRMQVLEKPENKLYFERSISRFCRVQVGKNNAE